jgi:hypothetical protein
LRGKNVYERRSRGGKNDLKYTKKTAKMEVKLKEYFVRIAGVFRENAIHYDMIILHFGQ